MKTNTRIQLLDFRGEPLQLDDRGAVRPMLLRDAACTALASVKDGLPADPEALFRRHRLAERLWHEPEILLTSAEKVLIEEVVAKGYGPAVAGAVYAVLEGDLYASPPA